MSAKTKDIIISAFLELVSTDDFDKITVTDLAEKCDISRQTFYYHFEDIDEMLKWTFDNETKKICSDKGAESWSDYAQMYVDFFTKYDSLLKKSLKSSNFILVYNLINKSFGDYLTFYMTKKNSNNSPVKNPDFLISCIAGAFSSLIIKAIQNENSNYKEVFENITAVLQGVSI